MKVLIQRSKKLQNKTGWAAIQFTYKLLGSKEVLNICEILLKRKEIQSAKLMHESGIEKEPSFFFRMNQLIDFGFVERHIDESDRSVTYRLTRFGRDLLELNKPLFSKLRNKIEI